MISPLYVFDICGTIFKSNTTFDFLTFWLTPRSRYYSFFDKLRKTFIWKVINKITRTYLHVDITRIIALRFLKGYSRLQLSEGADMFYESYLMKHLNDNVVDTINVLRINPSCNVLIASATIDVVAEVIASKMQINTWYSSELCYVDGICQGKLSKDLLGKKNVFIQEIQNQTIDSVYTDDFTDIPLLKEARQKNIVVYPKTDKKWKKIVKKMKWYVNFIEY